MVTNVAPLEVAIGIGVVLLITWVVEWRARRGSHPRFRENRRMHHRGIPEWRGRT
jgi:hypothetical protein